MSFWQLAAAAEAPALISAEAPDALSYGELAATADSLSALLGPRHSKRLGFVLSRNDAASVAAYLAALRSQDCAALLPEQLGQAALATLINTYRPDWVVLPADYPLTTLPAAPCQPWQGKTLLRYASDPQTIWPDTALLLSTSGSTGSPKMVRLSYRNLSSNAAAIADYLQLNADARPITTLPIHYAFGLSVLNSHLACGAAIVLSDEPLTARPFWDLCRSAGVTSLAGVPAMWQMLQRLRFERMALPKLRSFTQAGGRLAPALITHFAELAQARGGQFYVMYGQTEASPRIAYVPPTRLADKTGSIGIAIPGGELAVSDEGELLYRGPNVMLGYAQSRADLSLGDCQGGLLHTGDLARVDEEGYYWLTGRIKRIAKVFGNRVNLDEIEALLEAALRGPVAALDDDDALAVFVTRAEHVQAAQSLLRSHLGAHPSGIHLICVPALPLTARGKNDYRALREQIARP